MSPLMAARQGCLGPDGRPDELGSALLRHIEAFGLANNCSKIMLLSAVQRQDAHRFFERLGFSGGAKRGFVKYRSQMRA